MASPAVVVVWAIMRQSQLLPVEDGAPDLHVDVCGLLSVVPPSQGLYPCLRGVEGMGTS